MLANPTELVGWMLVVIVLGFLVCSLGLQKGVERITKVMMICLLGIMAVLVVRAVTLPGGLEGLKFYLIPDFGKLFAGATTAEQWATFGDAVYAAMGQAFFTLSLGISAMEIFGSYIGKERSLTGEALRHLRLGHRGGAQWRASSSSRRASRSRWSRAAGRGSCSSRCPACSTRCRWGSCGARCSSCS